MQLRPAFTEQALKDLSSIQVWTESHFGQAISLRYDALIENALAQLLESPDRLGVLQHPGLNSEIHLFHLRFSRNSEKKRWIQSPRHFIVFRVDHDVLTVLRVLHDSMDIQSQLKAPS